MLPYQKLTKNKAMTKFDQESVSTMPNTHMSDVETKSAIRRNLTVFSILAMLFNSSQKRIANLQISHNSSNILDLNFQIAYSSVSAAVVSMKLHWNIHLDWQIRKKVLFGYKWDDFIIK